MRTSMRLAIGMCVALAAGCAAPPAKHAPPTEELAAGAKGDALYRAPGGTDGKEKQI